MRGGDLKQKEIYFAHHFLLGFGPNIGAGFGLFRFRYCFYFIFFYGCKGFLFRGEKRFLCGSGLSGPINFFLKKERVCKKDFSRIFLAPLWPIIVPQGGGRGGGKLLFFFFSSGKTSFYPNQKRLGLKNKIPPKKGAHLPAKGGGEGIFLLNLPFFASFPPRLKNFFFPNPPEGGFLSKRYYLWVGRYGDLMLKFSDPSPEIFLPKIKTPWFGFFSVFFGGSWGN